MVYVGASGYSYDDWVGPFYPAGMRSDRFLEFYAARFPAVEINFTYYRMPNAWTLAAMGRKVPPSFLFSVKAPGVLTHERIPAPATFRQFLEALAPLREAGQLACVLAQFPYSFRNTQPNRAYLNRLRGELEDLPLVVEFRNAEWIRDPVFDLLRRLGLDFCCVDQPRFRTLVPPVARFTADLAYVRFHGRNAQKWWQHQEAWERYDYLYRPEELAEWVEKVGELAAQARHALVFFNNHYAGQAVQNAQLFTDLLADAGLEVARVS